MMRRRLGLLTGAMIALSAGTVVAQEQAVATTEAADDQVAMVVVHGLAANDLLNVRATTSPTGLLIGRVPNGTMMKRTACETVRKYVWCKVSAMNDPAVNGWAPERYLIGGDGNGAPEETTAVASASAADDAAPRELSSAPTPSARPDRDAAIDSAAEQTASAGEPSSVEPSPPEGVPAQPRLALASARVPLAAILQAGKDARQITAFDDEGASAEIAAAQSAFNVALAAESGVARDRAMTSSVQQSAEADTGPVFAKVPIPTPRPNLGAVAHDAPPAPEPKLAPQLVAAISPAEQSTGAVIAERIAMPVPDKPARPAEAAPASAPVQAAPAQAAAPAPMPAPVAAEPQPPSSPPVAIARPKPAQAWIQPAPVAVPMPVQAIASQPAAAPVMVAQTGSTSPAPTFDSVGEVPCARYVGQPMTRCEAGVVRTGDGAAQVTVTWPDGGKRIIQFRDGKPESTNSRAEFRFTREADLNMIRVGMGERFEIPDALPFGD